MPEYKEMYFELFNKLTDVIDELKDIQLKMEEKCVSNGDDADL